MFEKTRQSDPDADYRPILVATALFAMIATLVAADLLVDYQGGLDPTHVIVEGTILLLAGMGTALLGFRWLRLRQQASVLSHELTETRADLQHWRTEAEGLLQGLGEAIDRQFQRWALSPAEREVGLMLLKGLSHKQIAQARGVSQRTVRQQAHSLYTKADLPGRADLAAFFLEDLLLPHHLREVGAGSA
jgi:DNA-binding CsgD family transcriptional regulator